MSADIVKTVEIKFPYGDAPNDYDLRQAIETALAQIGHNDASVTVS